MKILILRNSTNKLDSNNFMFANSFLKRNDEVFFGLVNSLKTNNYVVHCKALKYERPHSLEEDMEGEPEFVNCEDFDLVWVMNQPHEIIQKDVWQILWMLSQKVPFVNSVEAMMFLNNKNNLGLIVPPEYLIESYISNDHEDLWDIYQERKEENWIIKPTNLGCGANVFMINPQDSNARALIQSMTGNITAFTNISDRNLIGFKNQYAVLQKYAEEVKKGEKRVIIAGGEIITMHGRYCTEDDHRSNFTQGGICFEANLSKDEYNMCKIIGERLKSFGVGYVGLDISYPYLLEFNIVNPGGMYRSLVTSGKDFSMDAIDLIVKSKVNSLNKGCQSL
ncbi:hypothetical protein [Bacillus wiedmannii]|uniref:hypothetical protein n=1 Tax=Bacillus wiedmannii TaxID=1890302 RepID=UPI000BF5454A|nr:hypothetical protein [Bacillus wiedmannii]PFY98370.1 hypothetical protein COL57_10835 [Bacillus wiedmannii]